MHLLLCSCNYYVIQVKRGCSLCMSLFLTGTLDRTQWSFLSSFIKLLEGKHRKTALLSLSCMYLFKRSSKWQYSTKVCFEQCSKIFPWVQKLWSRKYWYNAAFYQYKTLSNKNVVTKRERCHLFYVISCKLWCFLAHIWWFSQSRKKTSSHWSVSKKADGGDFE